MSETNEEREEREEREARDAERDNARRKAASEMADDKPTAEDPDDPNAESE